MPYEIKHQDTANLRPVKSKMSQWRRLDRSTVDTTVATNRQPCLREPPELSNKKYLIYPEFRRPAPEGCHVMVQTKQSPDSDISNCPTLTETLNERGTGRNNHMHNQKEMGTYQLLRTLIKNDLRAGG